VSAAAATEHEHMIVLRGGTFRMASDRLDPEERPEREVPVDGFSIDRHPVTVADFLPRLGLS
jgi:formylglycine-generating enzyme required for sulfatase activity